MAKAKWYDYLWAWADPYVAINKNGDLVHANSLFDSGGASTPLSDTALSSAYKALYDPFYSMGGQYATEMDNRRATADNDYVNGGNGYSGYNFDDPFWNSLSTAEKRSFIDSYGDTASPELIRQHLNELSAIGDFNQKAPTFNWNADDVYKNIDTDLKSVFDPMYARLDEEIKSNTDSFNEQLRSDAEYYNKKASGLLSNQYLANAQTYDALQSDMRKARQTALEAGASAGIRLAGNINALLTAQNKQSQTAMDTSNALAEMMLQQRNAAAGIRSDYRNYMSDANERRNSLDMQKQSMRGDEYDRRYQGAQDTYASQMDKFNTDKTDWENKFSNISPSNKFTSSYQNWYRNN